VPQEATDAGDARVVADLEHAAVVPVAVEVQCGDVVLPVVDVDLHGAELENAEGAIVAADAALADEHRPRRVELDGEGAGCDRRRQDHERHGAWRGRALA
jgi:hypothetical protein